MQKFLTYILITFALFAFTANTVKAQEVAGSSAAIKTAVQAQNGFDYRVENLRNFLLKFNSPLASFAPDFVNFADLYGLDYRLVPSISGVESTFGKQIPYNSYNAYGWANGNFSFKSWPDSIGVVSQTLRTKYIDKGAASIYRISRIYAPPSTTWAGKVTYFVGKIDTLPLNFDII